MSFILDYIVSLLFSTIAVPSVQYARGAVRYIIYLCNNFYYFHAKRFLRRYAKAAEGFTCVRAHVTDCDNPSKRVSTFTANIMQNLLTSFICVYNINAFLQSRHRYHLSVATWIIRPAPLRLSSLVSSYIGIYLVPSTSYVVQTLNRLQAGLIGPSACRLSINSLSQVVRVSRLQNAVSLFDIVSDADRVVCFVDFL